MIERGIIPPNAPDMRAARRSGYAAGPAPVMDFDYAEWQANRMLHKGVTVAMVGLALLIGLSFINPLVGHPGPWLLGGLIPLFIGIAQIIVAVLSGARLGSAGRYAPPPPLGQPSAPASGTYQAPPRDVAAGPYAWRPGATTELERPPSPPDQR